MAQTFFEVVSSNFAHNVSAPSGLPAFFDILSRRHFVSYKSIASLSKSLSSFLSVLAYQRGQRLRQSATAHSQELSLIVSISS